MASPSPEPSPPTASGPPWDPCPPPAHTEAPGNGTVACPEPPTSAYTRASRYWASGASFASRLFPHGATGVAQVVGDGAGRPTDHAAAGVDADSVVDGPRERTVDPPGRFPSALARALVRCLLTRAANYRASTQSSPTTSVTPLPDGVAPEAPMAPGLSTGTIVAQTRPLESLPVRLLERGPRLIVSLVWTPERAARAWG